ncbi:MAG TPA: hypothetical protein VE957_15820 [Terriglobales bacterium]|nr:hypothetical protein [Terriglobales bacterium]
MVRRADPIHFGEKVSVERLREQECEGDVRSAHEDSFHRERTNPRKTANLHPGNRKGCDIGYAPAVFAWVLGVLADHGLLQGQRIAIDATTLEANAAMRSIVRRDTGASYEEFLRGLAKASGIATPTREDLARLDRKRKKRMSNKEWKSPADEDARIAKMKDGRTHLAHKAEHMRLYRQADVHQGAPHCTRATIPGSVRRDKR